VPADLRPAPLVRIADLRLAHPLDENVRAALLTRLGTLPPKSGIILETLLYRGELQRGDVAEVLGVGERQGRRIIATLSEKEVVTSETRDRYCLPS
jgi:hypothetical protein